MASVKLIGIRGKVKKAKMKKDWESVDQAAEDGLTINPWDAHLNADIGEACRKLGFDEVAVFGYEKALESDPDNKNFNKALAELLEQRGEYSAAGNIWEKIKKIDPLDGEARSKATQLQATSVLDRGGYEGADSTKDAMADHEIAKRLKVAKPGQADGPGMSEEADLQRAARKEPDKKEPFLKLGDFYRRVGKLNEAKAAFEKALEISGGDAAIREQVEDIELDQMRKKLDTAKENAAKNPDDEILKKKRATLAVELIRREMEVFKARIEQYPADLRLKFELGQRYMRVKKFALAIPLIQRCVQDNRLEVRALAALGECFRAEKKGTLARRQYEKAVPKLDQHDDPKLFLDVHYWLGRLCEEAGDAAAVEDHYGEVLVVDYDYKDTRSRLENLQGG